MADGNKDVPYMVHEGTMARMEKIISKLCIVIILLLILLAGTNIAWVCYENQFEDIVTTQEADVDTGSGNAFINNGGDMNYGTYKSETDN